MKELSYRLLPEELDSLAELGREAWRELRVPNATIHEARRAGAGWYTLTGLFVDVGTEYHLGVQGHELENGDEVFRLAVTRRNQCPSLFDPASFSHGIAPVSGVAVPNDLSLGSLIGPTNALFLLGKRETQSVPVVGEHFKVQLSCDAGLLVLNPTVALVIIVDETPYNIRLTTDTHLVTAAIESFEEVALIR